MSINTATVETLTAEVRVLMVGSRQVTLSVAKQLDVIALDALEPFGRVKISADADFVVGRRRADGALVLARYGGAQQIGYVFDDDVTAPILMCDRVLRRGFVNEAEAEIVWKGWRIVPIGRAWAHRECGHNSVGYRGEGCHYLPNGQEEVLTSVVAKSRAAWELDQAARNLPLIVLAGLK